jgi:hypothetical protein
MNVWRLSGIATALAVFTGATALAAGMTKDEYTAAKKRIAAEYQADRQKCGAHLGNPAELCVARARGAQEVARAELEATYKPSPRTNYDAAMARAHADYVIAGEECDRQTGRVREACVKDAKAARDRAKAAAEAARKAAKP